MLYRKIFEILHGVMALLVLFEQILINLFASHSESFTKYFVRTFSICAYLLPPFCLSFGVLHQAFCLHIFDLCVLTSG